MAYTTIDDPSAHFQAVLYSGSGSDNAVTNSGNSDLQADLLLCKRRNDTGNTLVFDSSRGTGGFNGDGDSLYLESTDTDEETHNDNDHLKSFNSDGFTMQGASSRSNRSGDSFVAWQWKANGGTRTTVSASGANPAYGKQVNTTAGFGIYDFVGNTTNDAMIAHGLEGQPDYIINKSRDAPARNWMVSSKHLGGIDVNLSETRAGIDYGGDSPLMDSNTTNIILDDRDESNKTDDNHIMYAWKAIQGYSKFGVYTGNGDVNGPFVYTGFKPAWLMIKRKDGIANWAIYDNARNPSNKVIYYVLANDTAADGGDGLMEFTANGFKQRSPSGYTDDNVDGGTYLYACFAENPFVTSSGVPCTAR